MTAEIQMKTTRTTWAPVIQLAKILESGHVKRGQEIEKSIFSYVTNGLVRVQTVLAVSRSRCS